MLALLLACSVLMYLIRNDNKLLDTRMKNTDRTQVNMQVKDRYNSFV